MTQPLRIFIVEDEAVVLMHLETLLEAAGHNVVGTAMDADEAADMIHDTLPEVVLLDLHLRDGSSGLEVARAIRDLEDTIVVFLTANVRKLDNDMEGAVAAIAKPFNEAMLEGSLAYLKECVRRPPPTLALPFGMHVAPAYIAKMQTSVRL